MVNLVHFLASVLAVFWAENQNPDFEIFNMHSMFKTKFLEQSLHILRNWKKSVIL